MTVSILSRAVFTAWYRMVPSSMPRPLMKLSRWSLLDELSRVSLLSVISLLNPMMPTYKPGWVVSGLSLPQLVNSVVVSSKAAIRKRCFFMISMF